MANGEGSGVVMKCVIARVLHGAFASGVQVVSDSINFQGVGIMPEPAFQLSWPLAVVICVAILTMGICSTISEWIRVAHMRPLKGCRKHPYIDIPNNDDETAQSACDSLAGKTLSPSREEYGVIDSSLADAIRERSRIDPGAPGCIVSGSSPFVEKSRPSPDSFADSFAAVTKTTMDIKP